MVYLNWVVILSVLPILLIAYLAAVYTILHWWWRGQHDPANVLEQYFAIIYTPFVFGVAGAYIVTVGLPTINVRPRFLLAVPLGAAAYYVTTLVWRYYTGNPIRRGGRNLSTNLVGLGATFPEELLFRAGLRSLTSSIGTVGYLVYSSVLFGVYHFNGDYHEVVFKTLLGVLLGVTYLVSGSIVVPMLVHFGYNLAWLLFVSGRFP